MNPLATREGLRAFIAEAVYAWAASADLTAMPAPTRDSIISSFVTETVMRTLEDTGLLDGLT